MRIALVLVLLFFLSFGTASAITLQMDFTATGIVEAFGRSYPVPQDTVSGSIIYEAEGSLLSSLLGIDMSIDGYSYSLGDITFNQTGGQFIFYNPDAGEAVNSVRVNDFFLRLNYLAPDQLQYISSASSPYMMYSTEDSRGIFDNFPSSGKYSVSEYRPDNTPAPVPEPSTFLLLGGGLAGLAFYARRRRKE